jgi:putative transposase
LQPEDWRWSSYRACAGLELAHSFLRPDEVLRLFSNDPARARAAYRTFVSEGHGSVAATVAGV